ncbi:MAG: tetratricopeptide repeat protein [Phormidium sp. GEM2.Bin31]|nr:MAG: tetratricopeptide repeat protein [Phormidium sp. GEM2.Bin31]
MISQVEKAAQLRRTGRLEEAVMAYQKVIEADPDFYWAYHNLGKTLDELGRWDAAISTFRQAIGVNPMARWSYFHLGDVLAKQEEWSEAIACYQKALELQLNQPQVFARLGAALETVERWEEAVAVYEKAVRLSPESSLAPPLGRALYYRGQSLEEEGKWQEAVELYQQALKVAIELGKVQREPSGNPLELYKEAVVKWRQALESRPLLSERKQPSQDELAQLGMLLTTDNLKIWQTQVSEAQDLEDLKTWLMAAHLGFPKNNKISDRLLIAGWILPKEHDIGSVTIIAKSAESEQEEILSVQRPDVIKKKLKANPQEHPLLSCGFHFEVTPAERLELYVSIEGHKYHWKTIEMTPVTDEVLDGIQQRRNLVSHHIEEAEVHQHLGAGLSNLGLHEEAVIELRKSLELNPLSVEVQQQLKFVLNHLERPMDSCNITLDEFVKGDQLLRSGQIEEAVAAFQKAIAHDPNFHWSYNKLGEALEQLGRLEEAVVTYKKAIGFNSNLSWAYQKLGETLNKLDCWEEAVRCFRQAIDFNPKDVDPNPDLYWAYQQLGETLHRLSRWDEAVAAFRQAVAVNPTAKWSYFYLGQILARQEEWEDAVASYQKAIALNVTEPQVFWGLGKALEALNRWDEALATYQKTIELNLNKDKSYQHLGNLLLRQRQWAEAVAAHEKAVQLNPKSSGSKQNLGRALYYLGKSLAEQNQCSEAVDQYRQALDLGFDQGPVHYHLGKGLSQLGCYEEAVVELKQALEFNPLFLEWERELEYALNQLGRTLANESADIWTTQVSQPDIKKLNQLLIGSSLDFPNNKSNNSYHQVLTIKGWVLPKEHDVGSVKIIAKSAEYEREELLSVKRLGVITKKLNTEPEEHPQLSCGFDFKVETAEQIELYISIEGERYHWKTIKSAPFAYGVIARSQQTWRNYITNNLQDISDSDAEVLSSLAPAEIHRYIYGKPKVADQDNIKLEINYLDLSDDERSYLEKFLDLTHSPEFVVELVQSALDNGFCQIPNPFGKGYAICRESYHIGALTLLRFITPKRETFMVISQVNSGDLIYFPVFNLLLSNTNHIKEIQIKQTITTFIEDFIDNINYTIQHKNNEFKGIVSSIGRPSHFYYDICLGLYHLHKIGLLNQIMSVYKYRSGNFFLISSLFDFDENREFEIENLGVIADNCRANGGFYVHIGSNGWQPKNLGDKEKLSEMITSTAVELVDDATAEEVNQARECYPLLWFGVTVQKRAWVEQVEGGAKIITELAKIYPNIGVVFDGWTAPLTLTPRDINESAKDQAVVDEIRQLLPASVSTFTVVGSTTVRKLAFATVIDVFIANKGTGSMHVDRFAKKPGVVHISNSFRSGASKHLHYNVVNVPSNQVIDIPHPTKPASPWDSYSINPDVILNLVKEILPQSNP